MRQRTFCNLCTTKTQISLESPHEKSFHPWLYEKHPVKILNRVADLNFRRVHMPEGTFFHKCGSNVEISSLEEILRTGYKNII